MRTGQNIKREKIQNNKGFSIIELLIIIALMGVVLWYATPRIDSVFGYSAREANSKIYNAIISFKTSYMGKARNSSQCIYNGGAISSDLDMYMEIYRDSKNIYYVKFHQNGEEDIIEKLGPKSINISYQYKGSAEFEQIGTEGNGLVLAFDRTTGGFLAQSTSGGNPVYVKYIYCSSGTKTYKIELMPKTGKVMVVND